MNHRVTSSDGDKQEKLRQLTRPKIKHLRFELRRRKQLNIINNLITWCRVITLSGIALFNVVTGFSGVTRGLVPGER